MHRGWLENPVFDKPLRRHASWAWLIEHEAFTYNKQLKRGQLCHSHRQHAIASLQASGPTRGLKGMTTGVRAGSAASPGSLIATRSAPSTAY
jgi:hypothetical protein